MIDIDPDTVAVLRAWKRDRGSLALALAQRLTRWCSATWRGATCTRSGSPGTFKTSLAKCRKALGDDAPPEIRLHDLRHTHATLLLQDREPIRTVSERLGHASVTVTLTVYGHVMPGDQKRAAGRFAALIREA